MQSYHNTNSTIFKSLLTRSIYVKSESIYDQVNYIREHLSKIIGKKLSLNFNDLISYMILRR